MMKSNIPTCKYTWGPARGCGNLKCFLHPLNNGECWAAKQCKFHAKPWARHEVRYKKKGSVLDMIEIEKFITWSLENFMPTWFPSQFDKKLPRKPCRIFVFSQGDFAFYPRERVQKVIDKCREHPWITFQFLTKEPSAYKNYDWPLNCQIGFTVMNDDQLRKDGVIFLASTSLKKNLKYLYVEPMLSPVNLFDFFEDYPQFECDIGWVVVGGMTGKNAKPLNPDWVRNIRDWCIKKNIPFFFKSWGDMIWIENGKQVLRRRDWQRLNKWLKCNNKAPFPDNELDGQIWEQFPEEIK